MTRGFMKSMNEINILLLHRYKRPSVDFLWIHHHDVLKAPSTEALESFTRSQQAGHLGSLWISFSANLFKIGPTRQQQSQHKTLGSLEDLKSAFLSHQSKTKFP
ncbi:hypothetical protein F2Q69_00028063 [Brassica cretica]|uniref:Uncharacterized protein n=1 Tax=Brassica cretica TaxID=69181 RepID=A0A8S9RS80_BRACR|nr:hypothetical protein F2Q69_00028063 [Brassica cretica]